MMTLPKPTRRPKLGMTTTTAKQQPRNNGNGNKNNWWKPLVAIRWSSFAIFSLSVGILNLLNSHLVIHHDLHHHHSDNIHDGHGMHASIREILHRHYQKKLLHRHDDHDDHDSHSVMDRLTVKDKHQDDNTTEKQHQHQPHLTKKLQKKHKNANDRQTRQQPEQQQQQHQAPVHDESPSTTTAGAALFEEQQQHAVQKSASTLQYQYQYQQRSIDFIPTKELHLPLDAFSATWWQSRDRFLYQMQLQNIGSVEGACFNAIREHEDEVKMTTDWLDFSVEHLSRWWKLLQYDLGDSTIAYHRIRDNLLQYVYSAMQHEYQQRSHEMQRQLQQPGLPVQWPTVLLRKTIAVIAFMPYNSAARPEWGNVVTMVNLAATLASLARHGCGRIIVVTDENEVVATMADNTPVYRDMAASAGDAPSKSFYLIHGAFQLLQEASRFAETNTPSTSSSFSNTTTNAQWFQAAREIMSRVSSQVGNNPDGGVPGVVNSENDLPPMVRQVAGTEVAFVAVDPNYDYFNDVTNTTETHYLVPKAALEGLKQAMLGQSNHDDAIRWLGDHAARDTKRRLSYWRYVYLTEPDSILQTRPAALAQFAQRAIARRDAILIPHRLQPIPHESDVRGYKDNRYWVPELNEMQHVAVLDSAAVSPPTTTRLERQQRLDDNVDMDTEIDSDDDYEEDACCDGGIHRPKDDFDRCGNFWYVCGFQDDDVDDENYNKTNLERLPKYKRLFPYSLIRLQHGTGIVSLAATPHGRQCIPTKLKKNQKCPIPATISTTTSAAATSDKRNGRGGGVGGRSGGRQGGKRSQKVNRGQDDETNSQESQAAAFS